MLHLIRGILLLLVVKCCLSLEPKHSNKTVAVNGGSNNATKVTGLAESLRKSAAGLALSNDERIKTMREYWKETLEDIKNLAVRNPEISSQGRKSLTQWKLLLEENDEEKKQRKKVRPRPRFEGFASWERQLQLWTDEVSDYLEKVQNETGEYSFSTYGAKPTPRNATVRAPHEFPSSVDTERQEEEEEEVMPKKQRIIPAPAQPGEAVLPHTDIADKSKRILIVTTAALPWMTGTAVNPLLRAAYLVKGRAKEGGSVTLMLPWVERMSDQERVYGKDRTFNSEEEQEDFIRSWLCDTAKMPEASEQLQIRWYTAWQEPAENSLYAMGDITALVSADDVDICILEEPEHLNWYRAPGEHWTEKFKHVVGIIHTNYFAYAQEQPAALIRVS